MVAFAVVLRGQIVEDWLLFQPVVRDIGRYLQTGKEQALRQWAPATLVVSQLESRREARQPWSELSHPLLRLVRVERFTAGEVELLAEECRVGSVLLRQCAPIAIRLEKAEGRWRLTSYAVLGGTNPWFLPALRARPEPGLPCARFRTGSSESFRCG